VRGLGLIGLVLVLAIVGLVAKKQLSSVASSARPAVPGVEAPAVGGAAANPQQVQQQVKEALDAAVKTRQMPDDN
jgi:Na+-transporting methylmalonyl-CoA/oxaloacetate decarboxylase gamma subunit